MTMPGFITLNISKRDMQELESVMQEEGCQTKAEAFRVLLRDWKRTHKQELTIQTPGRITSDSGRADSFGPLALSGQIAGNGGMIYRLADDSGEILEVVVTDPLWAEETIP